MNFPEKTLDWMIEQVHININEMEERKAPKELTKMFTKLLSKLNEIKTLTDDGKKNRWFGYYQYWGECLYCWKLKDIIKKVRDEFKNE